MRSSSFSNVNFFDHIPLLSCFIISSAVFISPLVHAEIPSGLGTFTLYENNQPVAQISGTSASGRYQSPNGATGSFTVVRTFNRGYAPNATFKGGSNGLEIKNNVDREHEDMFGYKLELFPDDPTVSNTVKIAQTSYQTGGNSEVARQALSFENATDTGKTGRAYVASNPAVPFYNLAMGDYFTAKVATNLGGSPTFNFNQPISEGQLRKDNSTSAVFYYSFNDLSLTKTSQNNYLVNTIDGLAYLKPRDSGSYYGALPPNPTPLRLLKSQIDPDSYPALGVNEDIIPRGQTSGSYISYGTTNTATKYIVNVENARSVTLTYEGIMNGSSGTSNPKGVENPQYGLETVKGETENEWITFGIASNRAPTPPPTTPVLQCPAGHQMFYVGENPPANLPAENLYSLKLNTWKNKQLSNIFTFANHPLKPSMRLSFSEITNLNNSNSPYFGNFLAEIKNALIMEHTSSATTDNHKLQVTIDKPVSKFAFVIQDLDSGMQKMAAGYPNSGFVDLGYMEEVNVSSSGGQLSFNPNAHTINPSKNIVTAIKGYNCAESPSTPACSIQATWLASPAEKPFILTHRNAYDNPFASTSPKSHVVGYSDFYFCMAPPSDYTFSGIVFNDNGGITAVAGSEQNIGLPYSNTPEYFDGVFQPALEKGIYEPGLKVDLTDCEGNLIDNQSVEVGSTAPNIGRYSIIVPKSKMLNADGSPRSKVCLVEKEPNGRLEGYPVDTSKNKIQIDLTTSPSKLEYPDNNFGEVTQANSALVLQKRQYIASCDAMPALDSVKIAQNDAQDPTVAYSINPPAKNVKPGKCVAYKISAINRGNVDLSAVSITDVLQKKGVKNAMVTSYYQIKPATISPTGLSSAEGAITGDNQNGTIKTNPFALLKGQTQFLYFNTKYGNVS